MPSDESVIFGNDLKTSLEKLWVIPSYYYHLQPGGHVAALKSHQKNTSFAHLDIKKFFYSINKSRVTRNLRAFFPYDVAREYATASTVIDPTSKLKTYILPFGFVQSPILASLCLHRSHLGLCISTYRKRKGVVVCVYMDDLIISTKSHEETAQIKEDIKASATKSGFPLNNEKEEGPAESITAFNIILSHQHLELTKSKLQEFLSLYSISPDEDQKAGIVGYVISVNEDQAKLFTQ